MNYDPGKDPAPSEWLALGESERIALIEAWHRRKGIRIPWPTLHANIHAVVEDQIAGGEDVVIDAIARLRSEGLTRHEALHAVGSLVVEQVSGILKSPRSASRTVNEVYLDRVRRLTAAEWLRSG